ANFAIYSVTASITDSGTYDTITISHVDSSGSFSNGDPIGVQFARTGQKGDAGPPGGGISYDWDTSTSDADPGSGNIRGDNATLSSVTELYVSTTDSDSADETAWLDSLDDSSSTIKGLLQIVESNTPSNFALFQITSVTTASGYRKLGVTYLTGNGSFSASDGLSLNFSRTGDVGTAGGDGVSAGVSYTFSTDTTTTTDPGTGNLELNNATLASVTEIALDDNSAATGNPDISAWLATLDDSTSTTKGQLFIKKNSAPQNFAIYEIASITDATTHYRVTVTHVDSAGSFSASDALSVQFYPRGDAGSGSVSSVFGRSGAVVAASGDYDDDEVSAAASATNYTPAASTVAGHLSGIDTALGSVGGISDVVDDTTPQLGGQLDVNGQAIGDGTRELLTFVEDGSAVNHVEIENEATGSGPIIRAAGDDANVDLVLAGKGTGVPKIGSNAILDAGDIGSSVQAHDAETVKADTDDNFTAGYTATADNDGTQSSGTYTPDPAGGNLKRIVNGGAFTFAAPTASNDYTMVVDILNNASAGTITTSGFDFEDGASFTTTNGDRFRCFITKINGVIDMYIRAIQ
ncbi:MAG: hypothetical protein K0U61_02515, partial [Alphaproteobacteria bacterium]|nr:hypothetical protein [Alphaproteobacteria bacterium]